MASVSSQTSSSTRSSASAAEARAQWAAEARAPRALSCLAAAGRDVIASHAFYECEVCQAPVRTGCTCAKKRWALTTELRTERAI
jgi:hypothetical protein